MPKSGFQSTIGKKSQTCAGCFQEVFIILTSTMSWNHSLFPQTAQSPILTGILLRTFSLSSVCHPATYLGIFSRAPSLLHHRCNRSHWRGMPLTFYHQTCLPCRLTFPLFYHSGRHVTFPSPGLSLLRLASPFSGLWLKISPSLSGTFYFSGY